MFCVPSTCTSIDTVPDFAAIHKLCCLAIVTHPLTYSVVSCALPRSQVFVHTNTNAATLSLQYRIAQRANAAAARLDTSQHAATLTREPIAAAPPTGLLQRHNLGPSPSADVSMHLIYSTNHHRTQLSTTKQRLQSSPMQLGCVTCSPQLDHKARFSPSQINVTSRWMTLQKEPQHVLSVAERHFTTAQS